MLAALIVAIAYARPLVFGETFALLDQVTWTVPSRVYFADAIAHGRLPEWCDGIGLGIPFAGNPGYGVAYPPTWLVTILPAAFASDFVLVLHVAWLAVGTAALARALGADRAGGVVAAAAASLSGYVSSVIVCGIPVMMLAWTPWIVLATDHLVRAEHKLRPMLLLSAAWAAQLLAGTTGVVDTMLLALGWTLVRSERRLTSLAWLAGSGVTALPLAAVVLWPALHLLSSSERAGGIGFDAATIWSLHPRRVLEFVWPRLVPPDESNGHAVGPTWARSVYLSLPVIALAAWAVVKRERHARGLAVVAALLLILAFGRYTPLYAVYRAIFLPERLVRYPEKHVSGVVLVVAVLAGVGFTRAFARSRAVGMVAAAAICAHLVVECWMLQPLAPREALTRVPALLAPIAKAASTTPRARIYRPPALVLRSRARTDVESTIADRDTGLPDAALPFGLAHVPGYEPALDARWHAVWDAGAADGAKLLDRFDVQWVIVPPAVAARAGFLPRAELGGVVLAENLHRRPRAFVGDRACTIHSSRPEAVDLECEGPGRAVLLDAFADGWRATVDGAPATIERAEEVARGVELPPGRHAIAMRYRTPGLRAGALVSLLAWLTMAALTVAARSTRASAVLRRLRAATPRPRRPA